LKMHQWPGNIRELRNVIERSVILTSGTIVEADSLPFELHVQAKVTQGGEKLLSAFSMASAEMLHMQKVLNHTKGNKAEAARLLDIGIATLYRKMEEYKMK
ncbi:MAG: sigma-54-dependent Fis family transcriptional regulator, partial [Flavobacterium sp.]